MFPRSCCCPKLKSYTFALSSKLMPSCTHCLTKTNSSSSISLFFCLSLSFSLPAGNPPPSVIWQDGAGGRPLDGTFYGLNISSSPPGANKAAAASSAAAALEQLAAYYSKSYQLEEKRLLEAWRRWPPPHLSTSTSTSSLSSVIQSTSKSSPPSSPSPSSPLLIINSMRLYRLERPASAASGGGRLVYHCLVNNSNLAASTWRSVQIDLNCKWSDAARIVRK